MTCYELTGDHIRTQDTPHELQSATIMSVWLILWCHSCLSTQVGVCHSQRYNTREVG